MILSTKLSTLVAWLQAHQLIKDCIQSFARAGMDIQTADLLGHALKRFKLLETQQRWIVLHQFRRVK